MKVRELINALHKYDPNLDVVVDGYEDGYDTPIVSEALAVMDARPDSGIFGRHDAIWPHERERNPATIQVILVGRDEVIR